MTRERWGTFSVADHLQPRPFVADVLLYDRLIIPVPSDEQERARWEVATWDPNQLDRCLDVLDKEKDLVIQVPWGELQQRQFQTKFATAKEARFETARLSQARQNNSDPYYVTRSMLTQEALPDLPPGVTKVWPIAAYPSLTSYDDDVNASKGERRERLGLVLKHRFLIPHPAGKSDIELLEEAVTLARRDDFREKRAAFHRWQEDVIEQDISDEKAVEEMEQYLTSFDAVVRKASRSVYWKFAFTVIPTLLAAAAAAPLAPVTAIGGLVSLYRFTRFDRRPVIDAGDCEAAAMIHDVRDKLLWEA